MDDRLTAALAALLDYQQADIDGVMVTASRQAIHEVTDSVMAQQVRIAELEVENKRLNEWADGFSDRQLKERMAGDARIKEIEEDLAGEKSANAALKEQLAGKWLPIENAPKDGSRFMCYEKNAVWNVTSAFMVRLDSGFTCVSLQIDGNDYNAKATHWQPLPPAPKGPDA